MKKCVKCGRITRSNNLTVCSMCGGNLIKAEDFPETEGYSRENEAHSQEIVNKDGERKTAFIVILATALIVTIVLCGYLAIQLYNENEERSYSSTEKMVSGEKEKDSSGQGVESPQETENKEHESESKIISEQVYGGENLPPDFDVEAEVLRIREKQTHVEQAELMTFKEIDGVEAAYNAEGNIVRIVAEPDENFEYTRQYYFENGKLYFAFAFIGSNVEQRLYFYSDNLFRWIDGPRGAQIFHDLEFDNSEFRKWERSVKEDAQYKYSMF